MALELFTGYFTSELIQYFYLEVELFRVLSYSFCQLASAEISSNQDAPWALAGVGAAFIGVAIPISMRANNQAFKAAERSNQVNYSPPNPFQVTFNFIGNQNGIGLAFI